MMNKREQMIETNKRARKYLLEKGFDQIWFKPHTRHPEMIFCQHGNYRAIDLWNLWDGICFDVNDNVVFFQVKTNAWAAAQPIVSFLKIYNINCMAINVKKSGSRWAVLVREYRHEK